jgi:sugar phosphate isomerase/epimerase
MGAEQFGIHLGDLRKPLRDGMAAASRIGFRTIEIPAARGDASPEQLSKTGRRELIRVTGGLGLTAAALSADLPSYALSRDEMIDEAVARTSRIISLARDLGVRGVRLPVAFFTEDQERDNVVEGLRALGAAADGAGVRLAIQPVRDEVQAVGSVMQAVGCDSLSVCLDPGELIMTGRDPLKTLAELGGRLSLSHLRDAIAGTPEHAGRETRWGEGDLDWFAWQATLEAAGFTGPSILRRTGSDHAARELAEAREQLLRTIHPQ